VLLVVAVADSSRRYDTTRKAELYASSGVRELWVIDAARMKTRVFRAPPRARLRGIRGDDRRPAPRLIGALADHVHVIRASGETNAPRRS
jgi:hypothetical protein